MQRITTTLFALALLVTGCASSIQEQPKPAFATTTKAANKMFGDVLTEEDRSERRDAGCRSNGDATAADAEDCEVVNDDK